MKIFLFIYFFTYIAILCALRYSNYLMYVNSLLKYLKQCFGT